MNMNEGLNARVEEWERDLLFYLRRYHELASRSRNMKAVVDREIQDLVRKLKAASRYR